MGPVTRTPFKTLAAVLTNIDSQDDMREFLKDLLTQKELADIPRRFQIVLDLHQGLSHREVQAKHGVGIATVTRGAKELADPKGGFQRILQSWWPRSSK